ncbi:uncharacterized protein LOC131628302 [Vicia villosa]|uniref:uncharacterized protein LOC131628302 n=1 Tax=Vicia villosa TaxID=3911 RepID=UPI00273CC972|nr:uncharacterized protein LOC131628302 [Vicia villosa]
MAMVAKQGWNMLASPNSLVAKIFKARYFPHSSFLDAKIGNNPSFVWRSLWKAKDVLKLGSRWSIGGGVVLRSCQTLGSERKEGGGLMVKKIFDNEGADVILRVPLVADVLEDRLVWQEEKNGEYSVKSGYRLLKELQGSPRSFGIEGSWKHLWNISAPPRAKHLLWRICRCCLPTRSKLQQHHVQCPSLCPWCDLEDEDEWHVFFVCISTSQSWRAAGLSAIIEPRLYSFHDAKSLIFDVCRREDRRDAGRFAVLLVVIWRSRNNVVWQDTRDDALRIGLQAYHCWYDWFLARDDHNSGVVHNIPTVWTPPMPNQVKCNVDAGFNNACGTTNRGWCFKDHLGRFVSAGVSWNVGFLSVIEAEATALKESIQSAISLCLSHVIFESDCQVVVQSIHNTHCEQSIAGRNDIAIADALEVVDHDMQNQPNATMINELRSLSTF